MARVASSHWSITLFSDLQSPRATAALSWMTRSSASGMISLTVGTFQNAEHGKHFTDDLVRLDANMLSVDHCDGSKMK